MADWRGTYRKCGYCKAEYQPKREGQDYCGPRCRRAAAYGRERIANGVTRPRRKRVEASETLGGIPIAGSFRNGGFSSIEPVACSEGVGDDSGRDGARPERDFHAGPTPGALQGDDYLLEYYPDGYPKLPACLDRHRKSPLAQAA